MVVLIPHLSSLISVQRTFFAASALTVVAQVVAHQIDVGAEQVVAGMLLREFTVGRVEGRLRRRHREDQPAVADVDGAEVEHVAEERAVGFRVGRCR